jgi:hypothetical protein
MFIIVLWLDKRYETLHLFGDDKPVIFDTYEQAELAVKSECTPELCKIVSIS